MPITQVALSNTFNEFRETTNEVITNLNSITDGGGAISTNTIFANTITGGTISGNTITGVDLTLSGNLTVEGTQTVLNTSTLTVEDKNIVVANGAADASAANGAGLTIDGSGATIEYISANDDFQFNKSIQTTGNVSAAYFIGDGSLLENAGAVIADDSASSTEKYILFTDLTSGPVTRANVDSSALSYVASTKSLKIPVISSNVIFDTTGQIEVPVGSTADRLSSNTGAFRFNTDLNSFEGYNGSSWGAVGGGATGGGADQVFYENDQTANNTYTITPGKNAMTTGPLTIANGVTITVPSGSRFVIL
jgi:hypothetical protein